MAMPVSGARFSDLGVRILSAVTLAIVAGFYIWMGGPYVTVLAAAAAGLMAWELASMQVGPVPAMPVAVLAVLGAAAAPAVDALWGLWVAVAVLAAAVVLLGLIARLSGILLGISVVYVGLAMTVLVELRADEGFGLAGIFWLFGVVIAADVGAYFVGRTVGGPKLWRAVSPGKTWSGAVGGIVAAVLAGLAFGATGWLELPLIALLSGVLGLAALAGDLLESALKRRCAVKDASDLIPGHGGVLDRLDGLMAAGLVFALIRAV